MSKSETNLESVEKQHHEPLIWNFDIVSNFKMEVLATRKEGHK